MYLKIIAQYQENYGYYDGKEAWKNKGGDEFIFTPKDLDYFYEDKEMDVKIAERYLQSISNKANRYLLIECSRECGDVNLNLSNPFAPIVFEGIDLTCKGRVIARFLWCLN